MKNLSPVCCVLFLTFGLNFSTCFAQGTAFTYQGRLNNNGSPADGSYDLAFTLYPTNTGGSSVAGPITNSAVGVTNGLFTTTIDFGTNIFNGQPLWLDVSVSTNGAGVFTELSPRQQLMPTPYALFAAGSSAAGLSGTISASNIASGSITSNLLALASVGSGQLATNIGVWTQSSSNIYYNSGNVGIGTSNPASILNVAGLAAPSPTAIAGVIQGTQTSGSYLGSGVYGLSLVPGGNGIIGQADVAGTGGAFPVGVVASSAATNGVGVQAVATASSGPTVAVLASVSSPNGYAGQFSGPVEITNSGSWPLNIYSTSTIGTWLNLYNTSTNGDMWNLISTGSGNGEGVGKLLIHEGRNGNTIMTLQSNGNVGIGITAPTARLHLVKGGPSGYVDTYHGGPVILADTTNGNAITAFTSDPAAYAIFAYATNTTAYAGVFDGQVYVNGQTVITGPLQTTGNTTLEGPTQITGSTTINGATQINSNATITGTAQISGNTTINGTAQITTTNGWIPLSLSCSSTIGTWLNLTNSSPNGDLWNLISTGSANGEGVGKLLIHEGGGGNTIMTLQSNGFVGIGNTSPNNLLVVGKGGAYCNGTTWVNGSDRNTKQDFAPVDPREVLEKVSALPITQWKYKVDAEGIEHIGPMAQDFHAAFGLNGGDDKHISTVDEGGIALAAIQGLNQKVQEQAEELKARETTIEDLQKQNGLLQQRLDDLEQAVKSLNARNEP